MKQWKLEVSDLIGLGVLLVALPMQAQAQMTPLANATPAAPVAERRTVLTTTVISLYDSNIGQASDQALALRGIKKSDFRVTPSLTADVYRTLGTGYVSFTGSAGYDFNARNSQLDRERIEATAGFGAQLKFCGAAISAGYSRRQSNLGDLNILAPGAAATSQNTEALASINGTLTCGGAYGFRALAIAGYSDARNSALIRAISNNHAVTYGGGVEYYQPAVGRIRLFGVEREIDFFRRDGVNFGGAPRVINRAGTISFDRDIGARLSTSIALTYADVQSRGGGNNPRFQGLLWDVGIGLRATNRLKFDLDLIRTVDPSQGFNVDYIENQSYALKTTYIVNQRASIVVNAQHRKQKYVYSATATVQDVNDRTTNAIDASLKYAASDRLLFSFDAGYTKVDADNALFKYDSLRAGVTVSFVFK